MVDVLGWTLVHSLWEGALIALLTGIGLYATRRTSANVRYVISCSALIFCLWLPVLTFAFLTWSPPQALGLQTVAEFTLTGAPVGLSRGSSQWLPSLVTIWCLGVAVLSTRTIGGLLFLYRQRRRAELAEGSLQELARQLGEKLGVSRLVSVVVLPGKAMPCTWGILRPIIAIPASLLTQLSPAQVEAVLLHELAHIRRHDYLINLIQSMVETLLFFHPAVWWISSVVRREREHCCDDLVLAESADPVVYARALLSLEERRPALSSLSLSANGSHLMNRIARILGRRSVSSRPVAVRIAPSAATIAALAVAATFFGTTRMAEAQAKPQAKPQTKTAAKTEVKKSATSKGPKTLVLTKSVGKAELKKAPPTVQKVVPQVITVNGVKMKVAPTQKFEGVAIAKPTLLPKEKATKVQLFKGVSVDECPTLMKVAEAKNIERISREAQAKAIEEANRSLAVAQKQAAISLEIARKSLESEQLAGVAEQKEAIELAKREIAEAQKTLAKDMAAAHADIAAARADSAAKAQKSREMEIVRYRTKRDLARAQRTVSDQANAYRVENLFRDDTTSSSLSLTINNGQYRLETKNVPFLTVMKHLVREGGINVKVESGSYPNVSLNVSGKSAAEVLEAVCRAANLKLTKVNGEYVLRGR